MEHHPSALKTILTQASGLRARPMEWVDSGDRAGAGGRKNRAGGAGPGAVAHDAPPQSASLKGSRPARTRLEGASIACEATFPARPSLAQRSTNAGWADLVSAPRPGILQAFQIDGETRSAVPTPIPTFQSGCLFLRHRFAIYPRAPRGIEAIPSTPSAPPLRAGRFCHCADCS
jgi:hypothetical protein